VSANRGRKGSHPSGRSRSERDTFEPAACLHASLFQIGVPFDGFKFELLNDVRNEGRFYPSSPYEMGLLLLPSFADEV